MVRKRNPCPVGRKMISEAQRRIEFGLDVTNRSSNSTLLSIKDLTEDSFCFPHSAKKDRLEYLKHRRMLTKKIGDALGGSFNQFEMDVPPFDPKITLLDSCSECSTDDEEVLAQVNEERTQAEKPVSPIAGSQGRVGQGCSTPRNVDHTFGALKNIDVSAVSFNSTTQAAAVMIANKSAEIIELIDKSREEQDTLEAINAFVGKPTRFAVPHVPIKESTTQETIIMEETEGEKTGGTFTIRKDGSTFTIDKGSQAEKTKEPPVIKEGRKSVLVKDKEPNKKRQSVHFPGLASPASQSFGYSSSRLPKQGRQSRLIPGTPKTRDHPVRFIESNDIEMEVNSERISEASMMDAVSDPRSLNGTPKRGSQTRRSSVQLYSGPRYTQHTISSASKLPRVSSGSIGCPHFDDSSSNDNTGSFVDCDPDGALAQPIPRSGYRPRGDNKRLIQERLITLNMGMDDDSAKKSLLEQRRENFIQRRLNESNASRTPQRKPDILFATMEETMMKRDEKITRDEEPTYDIQPRIDMPALPETPVRNPTHSIRRSFERRSEVMPAAMIDDRQMSSLEETKKDSFDNDDDELDTLISREFEKVATDEGLSRMGISRQYSRRMSSLPPLYEDDDAGGNSTAEEGIIIKQSQKLVEYDSVFSIGDSTQTPLLTQQMNLQNEDSIVDDENDDAHILKPRRLIKPETPEEGMRRSKRTRIQTLRTWMGEQAIYESSPGGSLTLKGANRVVVKDPRWEKTKTTDPVKALDRERRHRI